MKPHAISPDVLLAHGEWVRALARRLLGDEALAEDVVQDTWVAALQPQRERVRNPARWLAAVVANISRRALRSRGREQVAGRPVEAHTPSPEEVLEREALRRRLVEAVLAFEEPYRSTVLLRYFEGLTSRQIAERSDLPPATVRTRLHRAIARLRSELKEEREERGLSRAQLLALAGSPSGVARIAPAPEGAAAGGPATLALQIAMAGGAAVLLFVLGRAVIQWVIRDASSSEMPIATTSELVVPDSGVEPRSQLGPDSIRVGIDAQPGDPADLDTWRLEITRELGSMRGLVLCRGSLSRGSPSLDPLAHARVTAAPITGPVALGVRLQEDREERTYETTTDGEGFFLFDSLPIGPYWIEVRGPGGLRAEGAAAPAEEGSFVQLWADVHRALYDTLPGVEVIVRDERKLPVPGATARLFGLGPEGELGQGNGLSSETNDSGRARFDGLHLEHGRIIAETLNGRTAQLGVRASDDAHDWWRREADPTDLSTLPWYELVVETSGAIEGRVAGGPASAVLAILGESGWRRRFASRQVYRAEVDADGRFRIEGLPRGTYEMDAEAPAGLRVERAMKPEGAGIKTADGPRYEPIAVEVEPSRTSRIDLELVPGPIVEGRVLRESDRSPVAGAWVRLSRRGSSGVRSVPSADVWTLRIDGQLGRYPPVVAVQARTDRQGRYRLSGMVPAGNWYIEVLAPGFAHDLFGLPPLEDGECSRHEHLLRAAGGIQGVAWSGAFLAIGRPEYDERSLHLFTPFHEPAPFVITGLEPGRYAIYAVSIARATDLHPRLAEVDVCAGELSWVDLRDAQPYCAQGRLLHEGRPVAGAIVSLPWNPSTPCLTGEDGRFELRYCWVRAPDDRWSRTLPPTPLEVRALSLADAVPLCFAFPDITDGRVPWCRNVELPRGEIAVQLRDEQGLNRQGLVELRYIREDGERRMWRDNSRIPSEGILEALQTGRETDPTGRVRFAALKPGRYVVEALLDDGSSVMPHEVVLGSEGHANVVLSAQPAGSVSAHVLDASGRSIAGARVGVSSLALAPDARTPRDPYAEDWCRLNQPAFADEEGRVFFDRVPAGKVRVVATLPGPQFDRPQTHAEGELRAGETLELELRFP